MGVSFGLSEGMKWFEKIHLRKRGGKKKDVLASNPHHTYFSDQPNINYKRSNGKINVSPGGLGSGEPELDPGRVSGRLAACTGSGRGEEREAKALRRKERGAPAWSLHAEPRVGSTGAVPRPAGLTVVPLFLPPHLGTTYPYKQRWLLMQTAHHL